MDRFGLAIQPDRIPHEAHLGRPVPARLVLRLILAIVLDTAVRILSKTGAAELPGTPSVADAARSALQQPIFLLVAALAGGTKPSNAQGSMTGSFSCMP